jgi:hypothetical protein
MQSDIWLIRKGILGRSVLYEGPEWSGKLERGLGKKLVRFI